MDTLPIKLIVDKGLPIVLLLLVVLLSYQAAKISLLILSPLPSKVTVASPVIKQNSDAKASFDVEDMLKHNIFGELSKKPVQAAAPSEEEAPETKLSLVLQGVSVGFDEQSSTAIISESKRSKGEIYWVGDSVLGKASLSAVYDDRVVLKKNGQLETLRFLDEESTSQLSIDKASPRASRSAEHSDSLRSSRSRKSTKKADKDLVGALNGISRGEFTNFDALLDSYGGDLEDNIEKLAEDAGIEVRDDGFRIGGSAQGLLGRVGLRQGDVVKSINDFPVTALKSDRSALSSVVKSCSAKIEVLRGKNTFVLNYPYC